MQNELELSKRRLIELSRRAEKTGACTCSDFLTPAEQSWLLKENIANFTLVGGYPSAERRLAVFRPCDGAECPARIACLKISPANPRFAESLTHRDYLGSLMALGLKRETMGDIVLQDGCAYVFCLDTVAPYIADQLREVRHTSVRVTPAAAGEFTPPEPPPETVINVPSLRLDALVAAVYRLSRTEAQRLFERELVLVNSLPPRSPSLTAGEGDLISVRGHGRFMYCGAAGETRKGRLRVRVRVY